MSQFRPFADDTAAVAIAGLNIENSSTAVSIYGTLDISRDRTGLERARLLVKVATEVAAALEAVPDLPDTATPAAENKGKIVDNPFD